MGASTTQLSWQNIVATLAFAMVLAGSGWTLFQNQFSTINAVVAENKASHERMLSNLRRDLESRDGDLKNETQFLRNRLILQRSETVEQVEFKQFVKAISERLDRLDRQLAVLESTRPTTGELQATGKSLTDQMSRLEERLRVLERARP